MKTKRLKKTTVTKLTNPGEFIFDFSNWQNMSGEEFHRLKFEAINFYRQNCKASDLFAEAWVWMKQNGFSKKTIDACKNGIGYNGFDSTAAVLCKLLNTGCPDFNVKENEYWLADGIRQTPVYPLTDYVRRAIVAGEKLAKDRGWTTSTVTTSNERVVSVQDRMLEQVSPLIADLEGYIDDWKDGKTSLRELNAAGRFAAYDVSLSPTHGRLIRTHFERMYNESLELIGRNVDADLADAYAHFSAKQKREYVKIYTEILSACDLLLQQKKQRKPRKKKAVSVEKVVSRVKYCTKDAELGLVSLQPAVVVGKTVLWTYNRKYRVLTKYVAGDGQTLSFKGTTLQNFDESLSDSKKLRKPDIQMKEWQSLSKPKRNKFLSTIRTKSMRVTGRVNADTILVKAE